MFNITPYIVCLGVCAGGTDVEEKVELDGETLELLNVLRNMELGSVPDPVISVSLASTSHCEPSMWRLD